MVEAKQRNSLSFTPSCRSGTSSESPALLRQLAATHESESQGFTAERRIRGDSLQAKSSHARSRRCPRLRRRRGHLHLWFLPRRTRKSRETVSFPLNSPHYRPCTSLRHENRCSDVPRSRELQREKAWSRIHLVPLLLAESDRDVYRRNFAALEREKEIMKDMPEWEVRFPRLFPSLDNRNQFSRVPILITLPFLQVGKSAYHTSKYVPNTVVVI